MTNSPAPATCSPRRSVAAVGSDSMTESEAAPPPTPQSAALRPRPLPRRARTASSLSSAASSSTSSLPSSGTTTPSGSPSPRHSAVPFSWEHRPGIPKCAKTAGNQDATPLPLPPPLRSYSDHPSFPRKKRPGGRIAIARDDPFAIALAECAKDLVTGGGGGDCDDLEQLWGKTVSGRRPRGVAAASSPPAIAAGRFGIFQLYGSCKTTCPVAEATVRIPRPGSLYALLDPPRRSGSQRS